MSLLQLVSQVINVPLKSMDLLNEVLLSLLEVPAPHLVSIDLFLHRLGSLVPILVVKPHLLNGGGQSFIFNTCISVVAKNVLLLHLYSPQCLLGMSLTVNQLLCLFFQKLIFLHWLSEFLVDKLILSCKGQNIFSDLGDFLGLDLGNLYVLFKPLLQVLNFLSQDLDLHLSFVESSLVLLFFTADSADLVLHIAELSGLLLQAHFVSS